LDSFLKDVRYSLRTPETTSVIGRNPRDAGGWHRRQCCDLQHYFSTIGRLKQGVTLSSVRGQLRLIADAFRRDYPNAVAMGPLASFSAQEMQEALVSDARPSLAVLIGAVALSF
jgi:hypothetical protein